MPANSNDKNDESNVVMRHYVRDTLLNDGHIFIDPKDVDSIYLTLKTLDEYPNCQ